MSFVMVPCPEEHVDEVKSAVMRLTLGTAGWDDEAAAGLVTTLPDRERSLVIEVAQASVDDGHLSYDDASGRLGLEVGQILHLVTVLNDRCDRASLPRIVFTDAQASAADDGEPTAVPVLIILRPVAVKLLDLLRPSSDPAGS